MNRYSRREETIGAQRGGPMSVSQFIDAVAGRERSNLSAAEFSALATIYGWGAGPDKLREYMQTHELKTYAATVEFVCDRVP